MYIYKPYIKIDDKISLRQLLITDFKDIYNYSNDEEFTKYLSFVSTKENTINFIDNITNDIKFNKKFYWGIEVDNKIIGTIGFLNFKVNQLIDAVNNLSGAPVPSGITSGNISGLVLVDVPTSVSANGQYGQCAISGDYMYVYSPVASISGSNNWGRLQLDYNW